MNNHYKITIPEPCHEDWNKMTPNKEGRFCMNCSKTVTDFSAMSADEIQHFFIENQNKKICGSFKNEQLERLIIQIPNHVLYTQTSYHKMFLLALFVAMGTTLFSCQDKEGKKQKIDKIEVIKDSIALKIIPNKDTAKIKEPVVKPPVPSMPETVIYRTTGEIIVEDYPEQPEKHIDYEAIFKSHDLEVLPTPEYGFEKFYAYFHNNYIDAAKTEDHEGRVFISFVVEKDGSLSNFEVVRNTFNANEEEVIRVLKTGPKWIPGKANNQIVRSTYNLPITFKK